MFRRSNRKRVNRYSEASDDSEDDCMDEFGMGILGLLLAQAERSQPQRRTRTRRAQPKRARVTTLCSASPTIPPINNDSIVVLDDSDDECRSTVVSRSKTLEENASKKIDQFFKSSGLMSDDEDEVFPSFKKDSEKSDLSEPCSSTANTNDVIVVDDIKSKIDDINNYCKETEEILKNAKAVLDKFTGNNSEENETKKEPESASKEVPEIEKKKSMGDCTICYESLSEKQVMTTKCGHIYCKPCMQQIATTTKKCPTCRKPVNKKNIIQIFI